MTSNPDNLRGKQLEEYATQKTVDLTRQIASFTKDNGYTEDSYAGMDEHWWPTTPKGDSPIEITYRDRGGSVEDPSPHSELVIERKAFQNHPLIRVADETVDKGLTGTPSGFDTIVEKGKNIDFSALPVEEEGRHNLLELMNPSGVQLHYQRHLEKIYERLPSNTEEG